jgi:hypothetical protein
MIKPPALGAVPLASTAQAVYRTPAPHGEEEITFEEAPGETLCHNESGAHPYYFRNGLDPHI